METNETWTTKAALASASGLCFVTIFYAILGNPWIAVLVCGTEIGFMWMENGRIITEVRAKTEQISDLEKQIVALRTTIHGMINHHNETEIQRRRAFFRTSRGLFKSTSSL